MTTIREIAHEAFTAVAADITDAIQTMELLEPTDGAHDSATGTRAKAEISCGDVSVVFDSKPPSAIFGDVVATEDPSDSLVVILSDTTPKENWLLRDDSTDYKISQARDIGNVGAVHYAMVSKVRK